MLQLAVGDQAKAFVETDVISGTLIADLLTKSQWIAIASVVAEIADAVASRLLHLRANPMRGERTSSKERTAAYW